MILSYFMELQADVDLAKPSVRQPGESKPYRCNTAVKEHPAKGMLIPALSLQQWSVEDARQKFGNKERKQALLFPINTFQFAAQ